MQGKCYWYADQDVWKAQTTLHGLSLHDGDQGAAGSKSVVFGTVVQAQPMSASTQLPPHRQIMNRVTKGAILIDVSTCLNASGDIYDEEQ